GGNYSPSTSGKQVFGSLGGSSNAEDTALELWRDGYNNTAGSVYRLTYASRKNPATSADSATGWWELKLNNTTRSIPPFSTDEAEPEVGPNVLWFSAGFLLGNRVVPPNGNFDSRIRVDTGFGPPTGASPLPGGWQKGDRILNKAPDMNDAVRKYAGWICID